MKLSSYLGPPAVGEQADLRAEPEDVEEDPAPAVELASNTIDYPAHDCLVCYCSSSAGGRLCQIDERRNEKETRCRSLSMIQAYVSQRCYDTRSTDYSYPATTNETVKAKGERKKKRPRGRGKGEKGCQGGWEG